MESHVSNINQQNIKILARLLYDHVVGPNVKNDYMTVPVTENRLPEIQEINQINGKDVVNIDVIKMCVANPNLSPTAIVNRETGKIEAYIALMPLKTQSYTKFKNGNMLESELKPNDLTPLQKGKNDCLLLCTVDVRKKFTQPTMALLIFNFLKNLELLARNGIIIDNFLFEVCSDKSFNYANLIADVSKVAETHYGDVLLDLPGIYEAQPKPSLWQKIKAEINLLKTQDIQNVSQNNDGYTMN